MSKQRFSDGGCACAPSGGNASGTTARISLQHQAMVHRYVGFSLVAQQLRQSIKVVLVGTVEVPYLAGWVAVALL